MVTSDVRYSNIETAGWTAGDYIRVWDKKDERYSRSIGLCFVLATGKIGKFNTSTNDLRAI